MNFSPLFRNNISYTRYVNYFLLSKLRANWQRKLSNAQKAAKQKFTIMRGTSMQSYREHVRAGSRIGFSQYRSRANINCLWKGQNGADAKHFLLIGYFCSKFLCADFPLYTSPLYKKHIIYQ